MEYFPLRQELKHYTWPQWKDDWRAGLNVALLAFPQGMAYAAIAGLPIQYGIFGSAIAAMLGPIFGGSRFVILGPTNATAVMVFASLLSLGYTSIETKAAILPLVTLISGIFLIMGAFLRVANLIQYVSCTVVTGYITAAAIYIIVNQTPQVLGCPSPLLTADSTFFGASWQTLVGLPKLYLPTVGISLATGYMYWQLRKRRPSWPVVAIVLALMSAATYPVNLWLIHHPGWGPPIELLKAVDSSQWVISLPTLQLEEIGEVANVALLIAFLAVLEGVSIGKSLAARAGVRLDANREMFGMGVANLACAFYSGVPASGSLTRSQLNFSSGAATALSSVISGLLCAAGAYGLGRFTGYIPKAVLGVLVIAIGLSLINRHVIRVVLKSTQSDAVVFATTFIAALLLRLDSAIILGTVTSILLFLRKAAVPELVEYRQNEEGEITPLVESERRTGSAISIVHVEGDLFFGAAELFRDQMRRVVEDPDLKVVILKTRNTHHIDATSVLALEELVRYMKTTGRHLLVTEIRKENIRIFRNSGLIEMIGRDNIFPDNPANPTLATARALRRASKLMGTRDARVSIMVEAHKVKRPEENPPAK